MIKMQASAATFTLGHDAAYQPGTLRQRAWPCLAPAGDRAPVDLRREPHIRKSSTSAQTPSR